MHLGRDWWYGFATGLGVMVAALMLVEWINGV